MEKGKAVFYCISLFKVKNYEEEKHLQWYNWLWDKTYWLETNWDSSLLRLAHMESIGKEKIILNGSTISSLWG